MKKADGYYKTPVIVSVVGAVVFGGCLLVSTTFMPRMVCAQNRAVNQAAQNEIRFQQLEKELRRVTGQVEQQQYDIRQLRRQLADLQGNVAATDVSNLSPANGSMAAAVDGTSGYNQNYNGAVNAVNSVVGSGENNYNRSYNRNYDSSVGVVQNQGYSQGYSGEYSQGYSQGVYAKPLNGGGVVDANNTGRKISGRAMQPPEFENKTVQSLGTYSKPERFTRSANNQSETAGNANLVLASTGDAARDYDRAYSYIKARDFDSAEQAFSAFIKTYPNNKLVSNAQYWYGETFYVRGDYEKAARVFAEGYQKYPKGQKAASNLLKLGMSLVGMGKPDDACIAFKQLKKDYSKSDIPVLKRADIEMAKIGCK